MMISGITVYDIQVLDFVKIMLGRISCIDTTDSRIESTTEDSCQAGFLETFMVSPLPAIFKVSFIFRLIIGRIQIVHSGFQASFHDSQVLIGKSNINHHFRFEIVEQGYQFVHIVCVDFCCLYIGITYCLDDFVAFLFCTAGNHNICKYIGILCHFVRNDSANTACTNNKNSTHFFKLRIKN